MPRNKACDVSDAFWVKVEPLIPATERRTEKKYRRATGGGRKPADARKSFSAILYVLRKGVSWRAAPNIFCNVSTVHRHFKLWQKAGFFAKLRQERFSDPEMKDIDWERTEGTRGLSRSKNKRPKPGAVSASFELNECKARISDPRIQALLLRLHGATDVSTFWTSIQSLFRESIPNNSMVTYLNYFDHPKTWKAARILDTTQPRMPLEWFERRWKIDITPPFLKSHSGIKLFRFSDIIEDPREFNNSDYFQQFFKPFGWQYVASLTFWRENGLSSTVTLRRTQEQGDYRPSEIELIKKLHPHIETVIKRLIPAHKEQMYGHWLGEFGQQLSLSLLLLDWTLEPVYVNREAMEHCAAWNFGPDKARAYDPRAVFRIPEEVLQACKELKAQWLEANTATGDTEQAKASSRIVRRDFPARHATITIQANSKDLIAQPGFLVHFESPKPIAVTLYDLRDKANSWCLTTIERDLVRLAVEGHSNKDIALQLHKSIHTVKHQLTAIYSKLGISGRRKRFANPL